MDEERLRQSLETLPSSPGVYVFRGKEDVVLYVGKARSLRSRVRSYFQPSTGDVRFFIAHLERELERIETFVTANEKEAALLENQLIKSERPRYNVKLRDDKDYLSLRLDPKATWPRLEVVRRPRPDGALYFGPYPSATAARQTLRIVNRHFQLRTCTDTEMRSRVRPCLQYQIKRCPGPCVMDVDESRYAEQVRHVAMFLGGRHDELRAEVEERMQSASSTMEYEQAAVYRDQLHALDSVGESQRVSTVRDVDQDAIGVYRQADRAEVAVLAIRSGKLVRVRTFALRDVAVPEDELVASFLLDIYASGAEIPDELLLPVPIEAMNGIAELLSEQRGRKVEIRVPQRGGAVRTLEMARENAEHAFHEKRRAAEDVETRLEAVRERLRLPRVPRRIECVDISHIGGTDTVAVFVAMEDAVPDRKRYRSFHVKTVSGGDDYGAMREVLRRRLARGRDGDARFTLPDLLVVDGGRGQLAMALEALAELGVTDLPVCGLAKERENVRGEKLVERIYLPGQKNPIPIAGTPALKMLVLARDEAHRASNALRVKLGGRRRLESEIDAIAGVGTRTRTRLLRAFGSVKALSEANEPEIIAAGATAKQARAILEALRNPTGADDAERLALDNAFRNAATESDDPLSAALLDVDEGSIGDDDHSE